MKDRRKSESSIKKEIARAESQIKECTAKAFECERCAQLAVVINTLEWALGTQRLRPVTAVVEGV